MWHLYYILLGIMFVLGLFIFFKYKKKTGIITTILIPIYIIWSIVFLLHRDWVNGQTELEYLFLELQNFKIEAIFILLILSTLIILSIYHIIVLIKENKHEK